VGVRTGVLVRIGDIAVVNKGEGLLMGAEIRKPR
jgi:hypothetical protein